MMNERVAKEQSVRENGRSSRTLWTDIRLYYYSAAFSHKVKENEEKESQKTAAPQLAEHTHTTGNWRMGQAVGVNGFPIGQFPLRHCQENEENVVMRQWTSSELLVELAAAAQRPFRCGHIS